MDYLIELIIKNTSILISSLSFLFTSYFGYLLKKSNDNLASKLIPLSRHFDHAASSALEMQKASASYRVECFKNFWGLHIKSKKYLDPTIFDALDSLTIDEFESSLDARGIIASKIPQSSMDTFVNDFFEDVITPCMEYLPFIGRDIIAKFHCYHVIRAKIYTRISDPITSTHWTKDDAIKNILLLNFSEEAISQAYLSKTSNFALLFNLLDIEISNAIQDGLLGTEVSKSNIENFSKLHDMISK